MRVTESPVRSSPLPRSADAPALAAAAPRTPAGAVEGAAAADPPATTSPAHVAGLQDGVDRRLGPGPLGHIPWARFFPDFAWDGCLVNPGTGHAATFSLEGLAGQVYVPPGGNGRAPLVFVEGANQWVSIGARRARRHADRLKVPMVVLHNPSFVLEDKPEPRLALHLHRLIEGAGNLLLNRNLVSEAVVPNLASVMLDALATGRPLYVAGESQGSMLVGQALRRAAEAWIAKRAPELGEEAARAELEAAAGRSLFVLTFGNAYRDYPDGPNYLHVSMKGDPVPNNGSRPDNRPESARRRYLIFDQLFPGKNNFENHNIAFVSELFRRTCELHAVEPGKLEDVFALFLEERGTATPPPRLARADEVQWPEDLASLLWDPAKNAAVVRALPR